MTETEATVKTEVSEKKDTEEAAANVAAAADTATKTEVKTEDKADSNGAANGDSKVKTENGSSSGSGDIKAQVKRQLEHYFGDYNLPRDKFLKEQIKESEDGWIGLDVMLKFQRLAALTTDTKVILESIKDSKVVEPHAEKEMLRRLPSLPVPDFNEDTRKANVAKTIYAKGFKKEDTSLDDLIKFFGDYEGVVYVNRRTYPDHKSGERHFKGSVFVTFAEKELAQKFLDAGEVKSLEGEVLIKKWQQEYFEEKDKENEAKRKNRKDQKQQNQKAKQALEGSGGGGDGEEKQQEQKGEIADLPLGAVLVLEGFKNADTKREDIKGALSTQFGVKSDGDIAFVYFNKGEKEAKLRFSAENAAKELSKKIAESLKEGEKFKVGDDELEFKVLEGQEETEFLDKCKTDMANQAGKARHRKGHKRHSGRPGYKGPPKRQRQN